MYNQQGAQFIKCKILEVDEGTYSSIVVLDLKNDELLILTVFPNWNGYIPIKGDIGYIEFEFCEAGITKYFNSIKQINENYKNTYFVFKQFVKETEKSQKDVLL